MQTYLSPYQEYMSEWQALLVRTSDQTGAIMLLFQRYLKSRQRSAWSHVLGSILTRDLVSIIMLITLLQLLVSFTGTVVADESENDFAEFEDDPHSMPTHTPEDFGSIPAKDDAKTAGIKPESSVSPDQPIPNDGDKSDFPEDEFQDSINNDSKNGGRAPELKVITNAPMPKFYSWEAFYIEIMFITVFIFYFINYLVGSSKNGEIVNLWYESNRSLLKANFALVGGQPVSTPGPDAAQDNDDSNNKSRPSKRKTLIKDTESNYKLWCSGRVGIEGTLIELDLIKRHDIFSMMLCLLKPTRDNLIFRVQLNQDSLDNFVLCIAQRASCTKLFKEMVDVSTFCPERKPISKFGISSERLHVMTEIREVVSYAFDPRVAALIKKYEDCIDYIHITDQFSLVRSQDQELSVPVKLSNVRRMATFSFLLPRSFSKVESKNDDDLFTGNGPDQTTRQLFQLAFMVIDRLRRFKLSREGKQKSEKNRAKIAEILQKTASAQRQELVQQQKEEQRRLERERVYADNDVELQRRLEKKEQKKEMKRSKFRVKQLRIKNNG